jgi:hypothetical protein
MRNLQQHRADVEAAQKEMREAQSWLRWISEPGNPVIPCEANRLAAIAYLNGEEMTVEALTDSFQSPAFRAMLASRTPADDRTASLKTIERITGVGETPITKWTPTETLIKRAVELEERRQLAKKSPEQLRQILKDAKPTLVEPELPAEYTRKFILSLTPSDLRTAIKKFGTAQINQALLSR